MNLPSRGLRESATTSRYTGRLVVPIRFNLILTNVVLLSETCLSELSWIDVLELSEHPSLAANTLGALTAAQALEHALHLVETLEQTVDVGDRRPAAQGDALAPRSLDELRTTALLGRHGEHDRLHTAEILLGGHRGPCLLHQFAAAREHAEHTFERAHAPQLTQLRKPVVHGQVTREGALDHLLRLLLVELVLRALDEREHVAHTENARRHAVGRERLQVGHLLAGAAVHDRLADGRAHREWRTAPGATVELGEDDAVDADGIVESLGDVHGLLAGHGVDGEDDLVHRRRLADVAQLLEQWLVDLETSGGVEDHDIAVEPCRFRNPACAELRDLRLAVGNGHRNLVVEAELLELLHCGGPRDVGCDQHRTVTVAPDRNAELGGGGGLARALEADQHDHRRWVRLVLDLALLTTEQRDELVVDDLHDLLTGGQRLEHVTADGGLAAPVDKIACDPEVDVCLEQGHETLAHPKLHVLLGQAAATGDPAKRRGEPITQGF